MTEKKPSPKNQTAELGQKIKDETNKLNKKAKEYGGQEGPDPTRYGDWEKGGRCTDF